MANNVDYSSNLCDLEDDCESALFPAFHNILPYQYEPRRSSAPTVPDETDETDSESEVTSDSESEELQEDLNARVGNTVTDWCECGECVPMDKPETSFCCTERDAIFTLANDLSLNCITQHPGFEGNCLNEYVVETSFYEFLERYGHVGDKEPVHKFYRKVAYRRFSQWVWHRLRRGVHKPLPSCATHKIRQRWPDQQHTDFKYAKDF